VLCDIRNGRATASVINIAMAITVMIDLARMQPRILEKRQLASAFRCTLAAQTYVNRKTFFATVALPGQAPSGGELCCQLLSINKFSVHRKVTSSIGSYVGCSSPSDQQRHAERA